MDSANGHHSRDLESKLLNDRTPSSVDDEKVSLRSAADKKSTKMAKIQHCIFTLLLLSLLAVGVAAVTMNEAPRDAAHPISAEPAEESRFQQLLNAVDPTALHEFLHEIMKGKYQHGVFREDKTAVEALHKQNAEVAGSLVELAKRQATSSGNATVVTTTAFDSSFDDSSFDDSRFDNIRFSVLYACSVLYTIHHCSRVICGVNDAPLYYASCLSIIFWDHPKLLSSFSSFFELRVNFSLEFSQFFYANISSTKTSPSSSRTTLFTTTFANGAVSTVTSVTVVAAGQADQTTAGPGTSTASGNASLQTGGVGRMEVGLAGSVGLSAVVGGTLMMVVGAL
ncbi:hypothetical protein D0Z07_8860 [Hyphodiscus hymeniophilus]|uniref:Uncharacterized protein n=1 Tax=Hyphodiscus hymeniophilus TaxID=353542 RepID=A0A9P6SMU7_9HELO|nr:hypothetical protein D0Z07_8860 [Hyphodiscus hymeniophilus]